MVQAWRAGCDSTGAARVLVPAGKSFMMGEVIMSGPCNAKKPIIVDIQGTLNANPDPSSYSNRMWILIEHVDGIIITGGGTINGQGANVWKYADEGNHMPVVCITVHSYFPKSVICEVYRVTVHLTLHTSHMTHFEKIIVLCMRFLSITYFLRPPTIYPVSFYSNFKIVNLFRYVGGN